MHGLARNLIVLSLLPRPLTKRLTCGGDAQCRVLHHQYRTSERELPIIQPKLGEKARPGPFTRFTLGFGKLASWPLSPSDFQKSWSLVWRHNSTEVPIDTEQVYLSEHILHNREYLSERWDTHLYASSSLVLVSSLLVLWPFLSVRNFNFPSFELLNLSSRGISAGDTLKLSW